jgi:hypothetical protein
VTALWGEAVGPQFDGTGIVVRNGLVYGLQGTLKGHLRAIHEPLRAVISITNEKSLFIIICRH